MSTSARSPAYISGGASPGPPDLPRPSQHTHTQLPSTARGHLPFNRHPLLGYLRLGPLKRSLPV